MTETGSNPFLKIQKLKKERQNVSIEI